LNTCSSTKEMMKDGKCVCGWCGSRDHITGDSRCSGFVASKKKQAEKKKKETKKILFKKPLDIGLKTQAIKNTLLFVRGNEKKAQPPTGSDRTGSIVMEKRISVADVESTAEDAMTLMTDRRRTRKERQGTQNQSQQQLQLHEDQPNPQDRLTDCKSAVGSTSNSPEILRDMNPTSSSPESNTDPLSNSPISSWPIPTPPSSSGAARMNTQRKFKENPSATRKAASVDYAKFDEVPDKLLECHEQGLPFPFQVQKMEEVRHGAFTEQLATQYKAKLVKKVKVSVYQSRTKPSVLMLFHTWSAPVIFSASGP
jgi:hypothetical protein